MQPRPLVGKNHVSSPAYQVGSTLFVEFAVHIYPEKSLAQDEYEKLSEHEQQVSSPMWFSPRHWRTKRSKLLFDIQLVSNSNPHHFAWIARDLRDTLDTENGWIRRENGHLLKVFRIVWDIPLTLLEPADKSSAHHFHIEIKAHSKSQAIRELYVQSESLRIDSRTSYVKTVDYIPLILCLM